MKRAIKTNLIKNMLNKSFNNSDGNVAIIVCAFYAPQAATAAEYLVADQAAYAEAASKLVAGDSIILKNGVWNDFEILFEGQGSAAKPITRAAEKKGDVVISGQSNLSLSGQYLIVSGLVFNNGFTSTSTVISFRKSKDELANHSRVMEAGFDSFNNPSVLKTLAG